MDFAFATSIPEDADTIIATVEEERKLTPAARAIDRTTGGALSRAVSGGRFSGKKDQMADLLAPPGIAAERVVAAGCGHLDRATALDRQRLGGGIYAHVARSGARHVALPAGDAGAALDFAQGMQLRSYRFDAYRTRVKDEDRPSVEKVTLVCDDLADGEEGLSRLRALAAGVFLTRDLVSEPANALYPRELARRAGALADSGVAVEILDEARMSELGMGALLGVGQGSERESQLVVMRWQGAGDDDPWLAVVGKGVCFDTGGISIKPAGRMEEMKFDMAGAGCVTGLMRALAGRGARANVVGVIGCVENMPSGTAQRPGDVVRTMSGQTIEVINTDAEGRLVLADALYYTVSTFKPRQVIDLATLTGAIIVALGSYRAGLFSNDDGLADALRRSAEATGEELWRMPLGERYAKDIESDIADMKNVGKEREAGSIAGAVLLQHFVEDTPWAHIDIAGTAWARADEALCPKGASGFGVRLLDHFVAANCEV